MHSFKLTRRLFLLLTTLALALPAVAQVPSLLNYDGPDRSQKLLAAANSEGTLTVYTAFRPQDMQAVFGPFEKKYGIKIKSWRSGKSNVLQRTLNEASGNRHAVDAILIPSTELEMLRREKILQPVKSPYQKGLIAGALPAHAEWVTVMLNVVVQAYNTNLIKKEELPKTYQDLLDPKWKGKLGIEADIDEWYSTIVSDMGEEKGTKFFNTLMERNGMSVRLGMSLLTNLVVAVEDRRSTGLLLSRWLRKASTWASPAVRRIRMQHCCFTITCCRATRRNY
jgi:iron(III) transport system substrate-binding protein